MFSKSVNERVIQIKHSNDEKNAFIQQYKPFIASIVQKSIGRYVTYGLDDELSIGLMAFEEAINSYDDSKGGFLSFAKTVIQKRLIDYYRKEKKHQNITFIEDHISEDMEKEDAYDYIMTAEEVQSKHYEQEINQLRKQELLQLKQELADWGLRFEDIAKSSPKHKGTKQSYMEIVRHILSDTELMKKIKTKKYLPVAEIEAATKLPRKTIERARNYVIAAVLILSGDYYCIREFIDWGLER